MRFAIENLSNPRASRLLVDVERWWDARTVALQHFGCEVAELEFENLGNDQETIVDVVTRWVGVDGGSDARNVRRMQWRSVVEGKNGKWREMGEYDATTVR